MTKRNTLLTLAFSLVLVACGAGSTTENQFQLSGFIEGRTYSLASPTGGRVETVLVSQGDAVTSGQALLQLDTSQLNFARQQAEAAVDAAKAHYNGLVAHPSPETIAGAEAKLAGAQAALASAQAALELLEASYRPFTPPDAELHPAENAIEVARAGVQLAEAGLEQTRAGALDGEIAIAQAEWDEALAAHKLIELQIEQLTLFAPVDGVVSQILVKLGEIAPPGAPLIEVTTSQNLYLTVYVPVITLAEIDLGDEAIIAVDSYPDESFTGVVAHIADQAQFTPTNVQTREERVKLVFAVEVQVKDPGGKLKPGIPADITLLP